MNLIISDSWNTQGLMFSYIGLYDKAIEFYNNKLKEDPNNYSALYNIAVANFYAGLPISQIDFDTARSTLTNLLGNDDAHGPALYGLGGLEALVGHTTEALDYLERAISLEKEAINWAKHDIAWRNMHSNEHFKLRYLKRNGDIHRSLP